MSVRDGANVVATKASKASKAPPAAVAFGGEQRTRPRFVRLFPLAAALNNLGALALFPSSNGFGVGDGGEASEYLTLPLLSHFTQ